MPAKDTKKSIFELAGEYMAAKQEVDSIRQRHAAELVDAQAKADALKAAMDEHPDRETLVQMMQQSGMVPVAAAADDAVYELVNMDTGEVVTNRGVPETASIFRREWYQKPPKGALKRFGAAAWRCAWRHIPSGNIQVDYSKMTPSD